MGSSLSHRTQSRFGLIAHQPASAHSFDDRRCMAEIILDEIFFERQNFGAAFRSRDAAHGLEQESCDQNLRNPSIVI
jgi:hypothetical protein